MTKEEYIELESTYGSHNYKPADVIVTRGKGSWVWDMAGKRYLDCVSGFGAVNHGHCHPRILKVLVSQAEKLALISRSFRTDLIGPFSKQICELTGSKRVLFMNSGAEAVETALKAVRKWGYLNRKVPEDQGEIIVCENNFHGRTIAMVGLSSTEKYRKNFGPFPPGIKVIPFNDPNALEKAITKKTAGFLVEPVQGEGGMNVPDDGYLKKVRTICNQKKIALVFDEIQCGLGRTGHLLAEDYENVKADLSIIGKSLGGGFLPVSAVLAREDMLDVFQPGEHGSTFGGNPLACAVGMEALTVLQEEGFLENTLEKGKFFKTEIEKMKSPYIQEVKGRGLMLGLQLSKEGLAKRSGSEFCNALIEEGLLCNNASATVVRFTPPLVISEEEAGWALERLEKVFKD